MGQEPSLMPYDGERLPEFILFGDSLTMGSFSETTQGFGLHLEKQYGGKVRVANEVCLNLARQQTYQQASLQQLLRANIAAMVQLPEIILFGASMTEWSFNGKTQGPGWFLSKIYKDKVRVVNEGKAGYTTTRLRSDFDRIIDRATAPTTPPTLLFTIFIGANDACILGTRAMVPWPEFSANIRNFIETILTQGDGMSNTKIVLITPPPINGSVVPTNETQTQAEIDEINAQRKEGPRYKTYMSKKRYAEGIMEIAKEYEETGRVIGLDYWRALIEASGLGSYEEFEQSGLWPGCGLLGAQSFEKGWFTDGLHLDVKGYRVLNEMLMEKVVGTWPELEPGKL